MALQLASPDNSAMMPTAMTHRVALYLQDKHPLREAMQYVRYAESRGFESVWQAESRLVRDAIVPMAAFAATTERIKIGAGVINNWTRNAALIAQTFSTLDDLAPDRILCGLGVWWEPLASKVGVNRRKPLQAMRETVEVIRRLLAMEKVTFKGEFAQVEDIEIDIVHTERKPKQVPIYIGATGMKMMELAGEVADGVLLNYLVSPAYNREAMEHLRKGAELSGRRIEDIDRPQLIVCSLDEDRNRALDNARQLVTQYLGQQPHIMKASGVSQELLDEIGRVMTWPAQEHQIREAMKMVPDETVQLITASGTPAECRAKVQEYIDAGCTCPVLYPLGDDVRAMIDAFAQ